MGFENCQSPRESAGLGVIDFEGDQRAAAAAHGDEVVIVG